MARSDIDNFNRDKNLVRSVLMQDLGLTRESLREMVEEIVITEVRKYFNGFPNAAHIDRIVASYLNDNKGTQILGSSMKSMVIKAAEEQVREFVNSRIKIVHLGTP